MTNEEYRQQYRDTVKEWNNKRAEIEKILNKLIHWDKNQEMQKLFRAILEYGTLEAKMENRKVKDWMMSKLK